MDGAAGVATGCPRGVYGLRVEGLGSAEQWLQPLPPGAGRLTIEIALGADEADEPSSLDDAHADLRLVGGGRLRMLSGQECARFMFVRAPSVDELLHPWLAPAAAVAHLWAGREALHGGAYLAAEGAVLVLSAKQGGKSTSLAWLVGAHDRVVLADDLIVIADGDVLPGPRCLDLRAAGPRHGLDLALAQPVRRGDRLRVGLPAGPAAAPVAAIVELAWGPRAALEAVAPADRPGTLLVHRMFRDRLAGDPAALLDLATRPMLRLTRPRGDGGLRAAAALLVDRFG